MPAKTAGKSEATHPTDLERHECLVFANNRTWTLQQAEETFEVKVGGRFSLNNIGMLRRLATLDLGAILVPEQVVADELAAGVLRRILPEWHGRRFSVYALTATRLLPAKTQRFIEFLRERLVNQGA